MGTCAASVAGSCLHAWVPIVVQLLGAGITIWGLGTSWWTWIPDEHPAKVRYRKLRGITRHITLTVNEGMGLGDSVTAHADTAWGTGLVPTPEEMASMALRQVNELRDQVDQRFAQLQQGINQEGANRRQAVRGIQHQLAQVQDSVAAQTARVALDGLFVAAVGVLVGMLGTFLQLFTCP